MKAYRFILIICFIASVFYSPLTITAQEKGWLGVTIKTFTRKLFTWRFPVKQSHRLTLDVI